jgi:hypothetical protein
MSQATATIILGPRELSGARENPSRDTTGRRRAYSATWDDSTEAVRFTIVRDGAVAASIERAGLEALAGRRPLSRSECLCEFRRNRSWIEALAAAMLREHVKATAIVLTQADIRFQLACEAESLPEILCV